MFFCGRELLSLICVLLLLVLPPIPFLVFQKLIVFQWNFSKLFVAKMVFFVRSYVSFCPNHARLSFSSYMLKTIKLRKSIPNTEVLYNSIVVLCDSIHDLG